MAAPVVRSLKGDRAFQRLRRGKSGGSRYLGVRWRPVPQEGLRVGIVVSRKVGNAVTRNRVRRRVREGLRSLLRERTPRQTPVHADMIVIARPDAAGADYHRLRRALATALERAKFL